MFVDSATLPAAANPTDIAAAVITIEDSRRDRTMLLLLIMRGMRAMMRGSSSLQGGANFSKLNTTKYSHFGLIYCLSF